MLMKNFVVAMIVALSSFALPLTGQAQSPATGIPGYYNPANSSFVPMLSPKVVPLTTAVVRTGTVKIMITLTIQSAISISDPVTCQDTIGASDASFNNSASASGLVTRSGSTGTLTIAIPYDWTMAATGELANVNVSCQEGSGFSVGGFGHSIYFTVPGFTVPTTAGTVTSINLSASM